MSLFFKRSIFHRMTFRGTRGRWLFFSKLAGWIAMASLLCCADFDARAARPQSSSLGNKPIPEANVAQWNPILGTVDVIIRTKDGFALATDSRLTESSGHRNNGIKLFEVGKAGGAVIAGLIGAELGMRGYPLRENIGGALQRLNLLHNNDFVPAMATIQAAYLGAESVAGLQIHDETQPSGYVAQVSAVSYDAQRRPEWITVGLPFTTKTYDGDTFGAVGEPTLLPPTVLGDYFGFTILGHPEIARSILESDKPNFGSLSGEPAMLRYYRLKATHKLDDMTLADAVELARLLVKATIEFAPNDYGVGGPVDVATVTPEGFNWVARKKQPYTYGLPLDDLRVGISFEEAMQPLDGFNCVKCRFTNMDLSFAGTATAQLIEPKISGRCVLQIKSGATAKMPDVVADLEYFLSDHCVIIDAGRVSYPPFRPPL
jgi:hypothetical protein